MERPFYVEVSERKMAHMNVQPKSTSGSLIMSLMLQLRGKVPTDIIAHSFCITSIIYEWFVHNVQLIKN